jgi:hypothetical protein
LRLAALIVLAELANPRMKEYDLAFATIPAAALYLTALAPVGSGVWRRAFALAVLTALALAMLKASHLPHVGAYIYAAVLVGAILTLSFKPRAAETWSPATAPAAARTA